MAARRTSTRIPVPFAVVALGLTGCCAHCPRPVVHEDLVAAASCREVETVVMGDPSPWGRSPSVWALSGCGRSILVARTSSGRFFTLDEDVSFDSASEFSQRARLACPVIDRQIRVLGVIGRSEATSGDRPPTGAWVSPWDAPGSHGQTRESIQEILTNPTPPGADWGVMVVIPPEQLQVRWLVDERPPIICGRVLNDSGSPVSYSCFEVGRTRAKTRNLYLCQATPVP